MQSKYVILYEILKKSISSYIENGIDHLPPERKLCEIYNVSRQTVRNALKLLENENIIKRVAGSGAYITGILPGEYSNNIALLLSEASEYTYPSFITKLENEFNSNGYNLTVFVTHNDIKYEREFLLNILDSSFRAVIIEPILSLYTPNIDLYNQLSDRNIPFIFINGYYLNVKSEWILKEDNFSGGVMLGKYLISLSHRKIGGIFMSDSLSGQERLLGLSSACIDEGIDISSDNIMWYQRTDLEKLRKRNDAGFIVDMIKTSLSSCTAIVCQNDEIAYWLIKELELANISVPSDISIVSFDNSYLANFSNRTITTLRHKDISFSKEICNTLLAIIKGQVINPLPIPWELVYGQSCASL